MAQTQSPPVPDHMASQRRSWRIERAGWIGMAVLVSAALAGLLGDGPLSRTTLAATDGSIEAQVSRLDRITRDIDWTIRVQGAPAAETIGLQLSGDLRDTIRVEDMVPAPVKATGSAERLHFAFAPPPDGALVVSLRLRPQQVGWHRHTIQRDGGAPVTFTQFVFP